MSNEDVHFIRRSFIDYSNDDNNSLRFRFNRFYSAK